ncbi:hypothetical protein LTSEURB_2662 [Salmonella enterica subsp. enterica serovar Urbana str. R8-2977]|uniref:Uncharacterized protein n=1 Tax=Salmonella enterica subsp. enterica serovar Urbana str. R8-2977 TaxID=913084 RepID=G5RW06_SALET|nr:hypothetical protein LTSEURB_2662 [Salmonella enterica subsp. enterica serovar Urbana str. R8-2977]
MSGPLPSTMLFTSKATGITKSSTNSSVMTSTASERRPHNIFCNFSKTGQVAITIVPAHANPKIKGCTIHKQATIMMAKNSTDSSTCAISLG